uniref:polynucleotide 5'-hydroxyl-kinase NOL9-like n=1 Tax=Styela clava TaxID=7725 RepID=UPI001939FDB0|nr:polynucleotide 5'-hydroxyl-kinase NOL9-like [Styela clava]
MKKKAAKTSHSDIPKTGGVTKTTKSKKKNGVSSAQKRLHISAFATYVNEAKLIGENVEQIHDEKEENTLEISKTIPSLPQTQTEMPSPSVEILQDPDDDSTDTDNYQSNFEYQAVSSLQEDEDCRPDTELVEDSLSENSVKSRPKPQETQNFDRKFEILPISSIRSCVLLGITKECKDIKIFGCGSVQVIKGCISILGFCLNPQSEKIKYFAPVSHSALLLEPIPSCIKTESNLIENIRKAGLNEQHTEAAKDMVQRFDIVLMLTKLRNDTKLSKHTLPGFQDIYKIRSTNGEIVDELCSGTYIVKTEKYFECFPCYETPCSEILSNIELWTTNGNLRTPVILTAGGKSTGKSTFNRFLVNKLLQSPWCTKICFLECDIGQPEFTPPGFVSVTEVSSPILGPPFTHIKSPLYSVYYGDINAAGEPDRYIESIREVFSTVQHSGIPVVVNTMGWNRGMGLNLLLDTLHIVKPTHLLQIMSPRESKNFPILSKQYVDKSECWIMAGRTGEIPDYTHLLMDIDIPTPEIIFYKPSDLRNLRLLSYLNEMQKICLKRDGLSESRLSFSKLSRIQPFVVKLSDVLLCITHETGILKTHAFALINAGIVGLCVVDKAYFETHKYDEYLTAPPVCKCIGLGIIRGVDPANKNLYVISHLHETVLKDVNCLTLGVSSIPECLYQEYGKKLQSERDDLPPYVSEDFPFQVTGSSKFRVCRNFVNKTP